MSFRVGQKVFYPPHGAGVIAGREERELGGQTRDYLVVELDRIDMRAHVPADGAEQAGLRPIASKAEVKRIREVLAADAEDLASTPRGRRADAEEVLAGGSSEAIAGLIRDLAARHRERPLSAGEHGLLTDGARMLASEMALALGVKESEIEEEISEAIGFSPISG